MGDFAGYLFIGILLTLTLVIGLASAFFKYFGWSHGSASEQDGDENKAKFYKTGFFVSWGVPAVVGILIFIAWIMNSFFHFLY